MAAEIRRMYLEETAWKRREKVLKDEILAYKKKLEKSIEKVEKVKEKAAAAKKAASAKRKATPKKSAKKPKKKQKKSSNIKTALI